MLDPRISLKNRWLAGILAFLFPGGGHFYQGRLFKGALISVCILSTFFMGMALGDWSVVYWKRDPTNMLNPYYAQVFVGLPALPALVQSRRYLARDNADINGLDAPFRTSFTGSLRVHDPSFGVPDGEISGIVNVQPTKDRTEPGAVQGTVEGKLTAANGDSKERTLSVDGLPKLGKPVTADPERTFEVDVVDPSTQPPHKVGRLRGSVPRSFIDRFEAPPDEIYYLDLHRELGKFHELALTFTMIAGLLNILAILDAVEGPAYGYGDEETAAAVAVPAAQPAAAPPVPAKVGAPPPVV